MFFMKNSIIKYTAVAVYTTKKVLLCINSANTLKVSRVFV